MTMFALALSGLSMTAPSYNPGDFGKASASLFCVLRDSAKMPNALPSDSIVTSTG